MSNTTLKDNALEILLQRHFGAAAPDLSARVAAAWHATPEAPVTSLNAGWKRLAIAAGVVIAAALGALVAFGSNGNDADNQHGTPVAVSEGRGPNAFSETPPTSGEFGEYEPLKVSSPKELRDLIEKTQRIRLVNNRDRNEYAGDRFSDAHRTIIASDKETVEPIANMVSQAVSPNDTFAGLDPTTFFYFDLPDNKTLRLIMENGLLQVYGLSDSKLPNSLETLVAPLRKRCEMVARQNQGMVRDLEELQAMPRDTKALFFQKKYNTNGTINHEHFFNALPEFKQLEALATEVAMPGDSVAQIGKAKSLKELKVFRRDKRLNIKGRQFEVLKDLPKLESLECRGIDGLPFEALAEIPGLKVLLIDTSMYNANEMRMTYRDNDVAALAKSKTLESVTLHRFGIGVPALGNQAFQDFHEIPNLKHLDLSQSKVSESALPRICEIATLEELLLNNTGTFSDERFALLHKLSKLKTLEIEKVDVSDEGLAAGLSGLDRLQTLNARETKIGSKTMAALGRLPWLHEMDFIFCRDIDDDAIEAYVESWRSRSSRQYATLTRSIILSYNKKITTKSLDSLADLMYIGSLELVGCDQFSQDDIRKFYNTLSKKQVPELKVRLPDGSWYQPTTK